MSRRKEKETLIHCHFCQKEFSKANKYINSAKRRNKNLFCSPKCAGNYSSTVYKPTGNVNNLDARNRADEFTPYKYYYRRALQRGRCSITLQQIKDVWEKQNGVCSLSGLPIHLHRNKGENSIFEVASLDRIDSSKDYEEGNVQFVVLSLNLAKQNSSNEEFLSFLRRLKL